MPKYRVLVKSFINNSTYEQGDIVEYNGKPGSNLELIEEKKAPKKAEKQSKEKEEAPLAE